MSEQDKNDLQTGEQAKEKKPKIVIKARSRKASIAPLVTVFVILTAAAAVLRGVEMWKYIDASTGFYTSRSIVTVLFYVLICLGCAMFSFCSFLSAESVGLEVAGLKSVPLGICSLLYAVLFLYDSASSFFSGAQTAGTQDLSYTQSSSVYQLSAFFSVCQGFFAILAAVYFLVLAYSFLKGSMAVSKRRMLALGPVCWTAFRLMSLFVSKISFIRVSDLFFELALLSFMTLFFMAFAQVASGVYSDGSEWRLPGFGLSAGFIAGALNTARLVFTLIDKDKYICEGYSFNILDLFFCFFVGILIAEMTRQKPALIRKASENEKRQASEKAQAQSASDGSENSGTETQEG